MERKGGNLEGKIYFKYGVMSCSKTAQLLMTDFTYRSHGVETLLIKPSRDKRSTDIESRIGLRGNCLGFDENVDLYDVITTLNTDKLKVVLCDEAHFLTKEQCEQLAIVAINHGLTIICYGLMIDFKGNIFDGAKALIEVGAKLEEIKSVGTSRLTHHLRVVDGKPVFHGDIILAGKEELYKAVTYEEFCRCKR